MRKVGMFALAFALLTGAALASMVRFKEPGAAPEPDVAPELAAAGAAVIVPVTGVSPAQLADTWGQSRGGGARAHQGIDIIAPRGRPVRAFADGAIEKLFVSRQGGLTLYQRSADGRWIYYYAHLAGYAPGLREGVRLAAGETLGFVGDTGNAGAGNTHLHFEVHRMRAGEPWYRGEAVNPYPLLAGRGRGR